MECSFQQLGRQAYLGQAAWPQGSKPKYRTAAALLFPPGSSLPASSCMPRCARRAPLRTPQRTFSARSRSSSSLSFLMRSSSISERFRNFLPCGGFCAQGRGGGRRRVRVGKKGGGQTHNEPDCSSAAATATWAAPVRAGCGALPGRGGAWPPCTAQEGGACGPLPGTPPPWPSSWPPPASSGRPYWRPAAADGTTGEPGMSGVAPRPRWACPVDSWGCPQVGCTLQKCERGAMRENGGALRAEPAPASPRRGRLPAHLPLQQLR